MIQGVAHDKTSQDTDRTAILMMLAYVEAECRRLGSTAAAHHAAIAASLVEHGETGEATAHGEAEDQVCNPMH
jgi:hypothetical protein